MFIARLRIATLSLFLFLVGVLWFWTPWVYAADSCTASVTPATVQANAQSEFTFSITNTGTGTIQYIKITTPSSEFSLINSGVAGWSVIGSATTAELYGNTIAPDGSVEFVYSAQTGANEVGSADWTVETHSGGALVGCTGGPFGTAIVGTADVTAPVMSAISVTNITSTTADIVWTTDEAANSIVYYGLTEAVENQKSSAAYVTSHSLTMDGLTASTAYTLYISSADAGSYRTDSDWVYFTTAATGSTAATVTVTTTTTTTQTIVKEAPKDTLGPKVTIETDLEGEVFEQTPEIEGRATDASGVAIVEYSTDEGLNWLPVDEADELGDKTVDYRFVPQVFDDGNYVIVVRAKDAAGNYGKSGEAEIVIDRLPPKVGGVMVAVGPMVLTPNYLGEIVTLAGLEQRVTLSAVGGPVTLDLFANEQMYSLSQSRELGLWSGGVIVAEEGKYQLKTVAVDGAENRTERDLLKMRVLARGKVLGEGQGVEEAEVKVFHQDKATQIWSLWDGKAFGQENPQMSNGEGEYELFLPPGRYYVEVNKKGYKFLRSEIFEVERARPINVDWEMSKVGVFEIGSLTLVWPGLGIEVVPVRFDNGVYGEGDDLVDEEAPLFDLPGVSGELVSLSSLRGKPVIMSFVGLWSPSTVEQIAALEELEDSNIRKVVVVEQSRRSVAKVFFGKGGYEVLGVVDEDGELVEEYGVGVLPKHFFLDRKGVVKSVRTGVLSGEELREIVNSVQ